MRQSARRAVWVVSIALLCAAGGVAAADDPAAAGAAPGIALPAGFEQRPAVATAGAATDPLFAAARAGTRIVAVGDHGIVVLSDDGGKHFRQARSVPTRATLNDVRFLNDKEGWIAGHWGVILHTMDGGETWAMQHSDTSVDRPLFTLWFRDHDHGFAAGLWSLLLATSDGGKSWQTVSVPVPAGAKKADRNLYRLFGDGNGLLLLAAEQGMVYRSADAGAAWEGIATGNKGTFWCGLILDDGTALLGGLAGQVFRSVDAGKSWSGVDSHTQSSITDLVQLPDGSVAGVGLDGVSIASTDRGQSFIATQREDRVSLTALVGNADGRPVVFSKRGVVVSK